MNAFYRMGIRYEKRQMAKHDAKRDAGLTISDGVEICDNVSYGPHGEANLLCVYRPKDTKGKLPCIVNFHGGGYFYGNKELYQYYSAGLAERGFVVVTFNYRMVPEHRFPAPLQDANRVMKWIERKGDWYGIDVNNVFLVGDSAGAQLVNHYATIMTNPEFAANFKFEVPTGVKVRAVAMNCGLYNVLNLKDFPMRFMMMAYARGAFRKKSNRLDVVGNMTSDFPPSYVATATHDFLRSHAKPLEELLRKLGVDCVYKLYGEENDLQAEHVFHVNMKSEIGKQCNDDECAFFKKYIGA